MKDKTSAEIERALAKVRDKRATLQGNEQTLTKRYNDLEKEYGRLSARDQDVTKVDVDLDTTSKARRKIKLTVEALDRDIEDLERQLEHARAAERARETDQLATRTSAQAVKLLATIAQMVEEANALIPSLTALGQISGSSTRPSTAIAIGIANALYRDFPEFRQMVVMNHDATIERYLSMFIKRAERATAVGGQSGDVVREAQAAIAGGGRS
jgi:hypothetical protein